jgi:TRAP-type transport system small permease protein
MSRSLFNLSGLVDLVAKCLMAICLGIAFVGTLYQVASRYVLNSSFFVRLFPDFNTSTFSFPWLEELVRYLFVWAVFFGIVVVYKLKGHAHVEVIVNRLSGKFKVWVEVVIEAINCVLFIVLLVKGIEMAKITNGQISPLLGINMSFMYVSIIVCSIFCLIHAVAFTVKHLTGKNEDSHSQSVSLNPISDQEAI